MAVSTSIAQLVGTLHVICWNQNSNPDTLAYFTLKNEILQMIILQILQSYLRKFELRPLKLQCQARTAELTP
jgi:hypothetical protein